MKYYTYVLLAKGNKTKARIANKEYDVKWNAPYRSKVKRVYAPNEEIARDMIYAKLKDKYSGFQLIGKGDTK